MQNHGFTILELVVCMGVFATLLLILTPALKNARESARHTACRANTRSVLLAFVAYAGDHADAWPNAGPDLRVIDRPGVGPLRVGAARGLANGMWALLFPDHWSGDTWDRAWRCPRQTPLAPGPAERDLPWLWMSHALWLEPASIREGRPEDARWALVRISDVTFPSQKAVLFEQIAPCVESPAARFWIEQGQTPFWPLSVALADGSVRREVRAAGVPAAWTLPFDATIDGVRGRDWR